VESEIYAASLEGYDIMLSNESLQKAKDHMGLAKDYYEQKEYGDTKTELKNVIRYLEDALFQLASARLYVYRPPAYTPFLTILLQVFLAILIFVIFYLHRRKERKPKALRKGSET
jgi:hypothetical protein